MACSGQALKACNGLGLDTVVYPGFSFEGGEPKQLVGFLGKSKIFMWVLEADGF